MDLMKWGTLGAVVGLASQWLLKAISTVVTSVSGGAVTLDLQSVNIQTQGLGSVVNTGLSDFAKKYMGFLPITGLDWIYIAIGGALFMIIGAYAVENIKLLQFAKGKTGKLATIFVVSGILTGWILSMSVGIPALSAIVISAIDSLVLSYILVFVDDKAKLHLVP